MKVILMSLVMTLALFDSVQASNDSTYLLINGRMVTAEVVVEGPLNLYSCAYYERGLTPFGGPGQVGTTLKRVDRYFLGIGSEAVEVHPHTYRKTIKTYLPNATDLHERLGKPGFRYENIPQMILFYNRFRANKAKQTITSISSKNQVYD